MIWLCLLSAWARTVAVMPFQQGAVSSEYEGLGYAIAGMVVSDVSKAPDLELVERARLQTLLDELRLNRSEFIDERAAVTLGKGAGAEWVVLGSWSVVDERFLLDARTVDVQTGAVIAAVAASGTIADFVTVEKTLVETLLQELHVALSAGARRKILSDAPTESFAAAVSYGAGLRLEARGDLEAARRRFEESSRVDPAFDAPARRLRALQKEVQRLHTASASERADAKIQQLLDVLERTPQELTLRGRSTAGEVAEIRLRVYLLEQLGRPCEAAEELQHLIRRHGGKLPTPKDGGNDLVRAGHRLGMYPELPQPGHRGVMLPPRGQFENIQLDAPGASAVGMLIGITDGVSRAAKIGGSLANLTVACAGPDRLQIEAAVRDLQRFARTYRLGDKTIFGVPAWVELELYALDAAALGRGLTADAERRLQALLALDLGERSYSVRAEVDKIIHRGTVVAQDRAVQGGLRFADIRSILAGIQTANGVVDLERSVCKSLVGRPRTDLLSSWDEALADGVLQLSERSRQRRKIVLAQALRLTGCVNGIDGKIPDHASAVAYLDTLPLRQLDHGPECTQTFTDLNQSLQHYRDPPPGSEGRAIASIVRTILARAVLRGCATL